MASIKYTAHRNAIRYSIAEVLKIHFPEFELRGSWKYGDFHLSLENGNSFSDIDLVLMESKIFSVQQKKNEIQNRLKPIINIKISIHPKDYLSKIPFEVSKNKNILEYLSFYRHKVNSDPQSLIYMQAKIMLWLLTNNSGLPRFKQIANELNDESATNLFLIKTGVQKSIDIYLLEKLLRRKGNEFSNSFFHNCIINTPQNSYIQQVLSNFVLAPTIHPWLKKRILSKWEGVDN